MADGSFPAPVVGRYRRGMSFSVGPAHDHLGLRQRLAGYELPEPRDVQTELQRIARAKGAIEPPKRRRFGRYRPKHGGAA